MSSVISKSDTDKLKMSKPSGEAFRNSVGLEKAKYDPQCYASESSARRKAFAEAVKTQNTRLNKK